MPRVRISSLERLQIVHESGRHALTTILESAPTINEKIFITYDDGYAEAIRVARIRYCVRVINSTCWRVQEPTIELKMASVNVLYENVTRGETT